MENKILNTTRVTAMTFLLGSACFGETVELMDGRVIELKDDGTFEFIEDQRSNSLEIEILDPYFIHHAGEYNQDSMRFMPIIENHTGNDIVGFQFTTSFLSAFGDEKFSFSGESSERVRSDGKSTADTFYYFEDNQFIANEPYDKLKIFEVNATGNVKTEITAVVFADGTLWSVTEDRNE